MIKSLSLGLIIATLTSCTQSNALELQGRLALKGTATHSYLVIEDTQSNKTYKIINQDFNNIIKKQKHIVKIKATLLKKAIGPGFPAVIEVLEVNSVGLN